MRMSRWVLSLWRRGQTLDQVSAPADGDAFKDWNRLGDEGWVERWRPRHRRRDWLWVRHVDHELLVYPGSEDRPRTAGGAFYRLNGNLAFRELGHPDGPSSVPWFVIRRSRVYPAEGHPESANGGPRYVVERMRRKGVGPTIRPVGSRDYPPGDRD